MTPLDPHSTIPHDLGPLRASREDGDVEAGLKAAFLAVFEDQISDFSVVVGSTPSPLPEHFRFLTSASVTVNVTAIQDSTGLWSM